MSMIVPTVALKAGRICAGVALFHLLLISNSQAQDVIAQARNHTVKITTAITYAFGLEKKSSSNGAGFLIDKARGWILTNAHVAARSPSTISIRFRDEDSIPAQKVYVDNHLDIAIIKVSSEKIPERAVEASLDCNEDVHIGASVIAFGHPWDLDYTATRGIISGERTVEGEEVLQTDAALNPGNSGGPLIDANSGRVLGINSSALEPSKTEGMNFAVPISLVCRIINLLRDGQDPSPPKIPIKIATTDKSNELVIATSDEPFQEMFHPGDRIVEVEGDTNITSLSRFLDRLRGRKSAEIIIERNGVRMEKTVEVPPLKDRVEYHGMAFSGVLIGPPTAKDAPNDIFIVHCVDPSSVAEQAQFEDSDQIIAINGKNIHSFDDIRSTLGQLNNKTAEIIIRRPKFNMLSGRYEYYARKIMVSDLKEVSESVDVK
jgi:serine protease Do